MRMHGTLRADRAADRWHHDRAQPVGGAGRRPVRRATARGSRCAGAAGRCSIGDQVRLAPRGNADALDIVLRGRVATIESIEQDYEDVVYLAVTIDDDPGADLGMLRQPGHRFFFTLDDVEAVPAGEAGMTARVLVAGIGNIFLGDDGFGVAVAQELLRRGSLAGEDVKVGDYGIRGYDLAYEILEGYETVVLIDATQRGDAPGHRLRHRGRPGRRRCPTSAPTRTMGRARSRAT